MSGAAAGEKGGVNATEVPRSVASTSDAAADMGDLRTVVPLPPREYGVAGGDNEPTDSPAIDDAAVVVVVLLVVAAGVVAAAGTVTAALSDLVLLRPTVPFTTSANRLSPPQTGGGLAETPTLEASLPALLFADAESTADVLDARFAVDADEEDACEVLEVVATFAPAADAYDRQDEEL